MFNMEKCRKDGKLARGLVWFKGDDGEGKIRWRTVSVMNGPNEYGQYQVECVKDGRFATTDTLRNLTDRQLAEVLSFDIAE